eukprot:5679067-Ditylum_brightwellii.AAC.2
MSDGHPMFQRIRDNKTMQDLQDHQHLFVCIAIEKHEQPTLSPKEATVWVVLCMAKAEQHQRATT